LAEEFSPKSPGNPRRPVGRVTERILRKVWTLRLGRAGFRDLENPENPDGPLSDIRHPRRAVGAFGDAETTAEFYRRMSHLAARFEDETDRAIAEARADGAGQREIKARLHVSQRRIERVEKQIQIWMQEPTTTSEDE